MRANFMQNSAKKNTRYLHIFFWSCIALIISANVFWIVLDQSPPLWDIAGHSARSVLYGELIHNGNFKTLLNYDVIYPPLTYSLTGLFWLFGSHTDIPQYSLILWIVLLMVSTYGIAKYFFQSKILSALAAFLVMLYPLVAHFSRIYDLDFPLMAITTAALAALLYTDFFRRRLWVAVFGILVAAALLTKWTAILFLVGPSIYIGIYSILESRKQNDSTSTNSPHILLNALLAILIICVVAGPWYLVHSSTILESAATTRDNVFSVPYENLFSLENASYYARQSVSGMVWPVALFILFGSVNLIRQRHGSLWFFLAWIGVPYLIMTFLLFSKESRYFLPVFPAFALLSIATFVNIRREWKTLGVGVLMLLALWTWTETSWGVRVFPDSVYDVAKINGSYGYQEVVPKKPRYGFTHPTQYATVLPEVVDALKQDVEAEQASGSLFVAVIPNSIFLTAQQVEYAARIDGLDSLENTYAIHYDLSTIIRDRPDWESILRKEADYIITKTGDQGPTIWGPGLKDIAEAELKKNSVFTDFQLLQSWEVTGIEKQNRTIRLYKNSARHSNE